MPIDKAEREKVLKKIEDRPEIAAAFSEEDFQKGNPLDSVILQSNLSREEAIKWESYFGGYSAVQVIRQNLRQYVSPLIFSHVLGYVGRVSAEDIQKNPLYNKLEKIGRAGIESFYEDNLRGQNGEIQIQRNAYMEILGQSIVKQPVAGNNLYLTIDSDLQEYSYKRLAQQIKDLGKEREAL